MVKKAKTRELGDKAVLRLSEIFKTMGDPTRLRIINTLLSGEMCVCDLSFMLGMESSAISHQLRILKDRRIVKLRKDGKIAYYSLDDEHVVTLFHEGLKHINNNRNRY
ncbi:MAG: metalloregulator ArsR/SmtB family transcription factor [Methanotrichaceae archaeon]|nr:metalloregulator ArsR/SmtB family transcription factor [Methanotrichaceae archaeon]